MKKAAWAIVADGVAEGVFRAGRVDDMVWAVFGVVGAIGSFFFKAPRRPAAAGAVGESVDIPEADHD